MLNDIEILLNRRLGLDAASIGSPAIARAVQERMSVCQLRDGETYWERLASSEPEMQELIESIVVPETWFFRDGEAFVSLARQAFKEWLPDHPEGKLRLLSLPCSTGEEAYSMAIALLDAGLPASRFSVEGVDISDRALTRARAAVYGKNSFRTRELGFRDRHFTATAAGYQPSEIVRGQVHFQRGNVLDDALLPGSEIYDVIFCRNLMIYFDSATQGRAIKVLSRLLKADGVLFVGPSETPLLASHNFASTKVPLAFAFRKNKVVPPKIKKVAAPRAPESPVARPATKSPPPARSFPPPVSTPIDLDEALRFADEGRLEEAAKGCEDHLKAYGPSAKAFYLLGLVRDAAGDQAEAATFYRKALYLDPHHHAALLQLALLLDKQGDKAGAKVLIDRADRLEQKGRN